MSAWHWHWHLRQTVQNEVEESERHVSIHGFGFRVFGLGFRGFSLVYWLGVWMFWGGFSQIVFEL